MTRRNLSLLLLAAVLAALCHQRPYLRILAGAMVRVERDAAVPLDERALFEGAMDGMLGQVDEHSIYIAPDELGDFYEEFDLQFGGIGIQTASDPDTKQLKVLCPLAGSPACRAGVLAGDLIVRIDGHETESMSLRRASELLRGAPGTSVVLTILHEGAELPEEVRIVREVVQIESVVGDTRNADGSWNFFLAGHDHIGYVRITCFTDATVSEFKKTLERLTAQGMRGLVLDMRDNPGGYLDAGVEICRTLIRPGVIVTLRDRDGVVRESYAAAAAGTFTDVPMAVVVNGDTASAAEIVAACLQDHHRADIVGCRTYGKGTVQKVFDLGPEYGAMKFTTASYWRPSGRNIQRPHDPKSKEPWGVSPDQGCQVIVKPEEFTRWQWWRARRDMFSSVADLALESAEESGVGKKAAPASAESLKNFVDRPLQRAVERVEKKAKK